MKAFRWVFTAGNSSFAGALAVVALDIGLSDTYAAL